MFLFWLPPIELQRIDVRSIAIAIGFGHIAGTPIGVLFFLIFSENLWLFYEYRSNNISAVLLLLSVSIYSILFFCIYLLLRSIGLVGIISIVFISLCAWCVSMFLSMYIVEILFPFRQFFTSFWGRFSPRALDLTLSAIFEFGLIFGIPSSVAFWLILHRLHPKAFFHDTFATRPWGRLFYLCGSLLIIFAALTWSTPSQLSEEIFSRWVLPAVDREAISEARTLLDSDKWEEIGPLDRRKRGKLVEDTRSAIERIRGVENKHSAFAKLARQVARWGDFFGSREHFFSAVSARGFRGTSRTHLKCPSWRLTLGAQLDLGDYTGAHMSCMRLGNWSEELINACLMCLAETLDDRGLPLSSLSRGNYSDGAWLYYGLGERAAHFFNLGNTHLARQAIEKYPEGLVRAEAFMRTGEKLLELQEMELAEDAFAEALAQISLDAPELSLPKSRDVILIGIARAYLFHSEDYQLTRSAIQKIEDRQMRELHLQMLDRLY